MRKKYEELNLEVIMVQHEDIVTTSGIKEVEDAFLFGDVFD